MSKGISAIFYLIIFSSLLFSQNEFKQIASDATGHDEFGISVDMTDDYVIIGAHRDRPHGSYSGSAYIYKHENGVLSQELKLVPDDSDSYMRFGWSVGISGNFAIIGAKGDEISRPDAGSVYFYKFNGSTWVQHQKLFQTESPEKDDEFGTSVDIEGNYAVVGAWGDDDETGAAYVYYLNGDNWEFQERLIADDRSTGHFFGGAVSIDGNLIAAGAPGNASAYVFQRNGSSWQQIDKLLPSSAGVNDLFGESIAIKGEYLIAGAYESDENGENSGSAYIFKRNNNDWTEVKHLVPGDGAADDEYGITVSLEGAYAAVGSYRHDAGLENSGAVYLYHFNGNDWVLANKVIASDAQMDDRFGRSVKLNNGYLFAGTYKDDNDDEEDSGSAYIFKNATVVGIEDDLSRTPEGFRLEQNYPNPFNPNTNIGFRISDFGFIELDVYDISGRLVKSLVNENRPAGSYSEQWDGTDNAGHKVGSGIYFYKIQSGALSQTRRMILLK